MPVPITISDSTNPSGDWLEIRAEIDPGDPDVQLCCSPELSDARPIVDNRNWNRQTERAYANRQDYTGVARCAKGGSAKLKSIEMKPISADRRATWKKSISQPNWNEKLIFPH